MISGCEIVANESAGKGESLAEKMQQSGATVNVRCTRHDRTPHEKLVTDRVRVSHEPV